MRFMACIAALTAVIPLSGCASADIHLRSGSSSSAAPSAPPGTSYSTAVFRADVSPGGYFALLLFGHFMAGFESDYREGGYGLSGRKPPQMAEDRNIAEMDCSQPMARPSANLRCK